ncbi:MAG: hypothetical protein M1818_007141 [Claussenomyces sp. TS43310]|nr:MAG: hypothetical protein M1818_007141 [Claussenomyces sp. TS43310]
MFQLDDLLHSVLSPSPLGLAVAILLVLTIPLFLHSFVFRASGLTSLPSILLIGPSGSGKTSLLTLVLQMTLIIRCLGTNSSQFERGKHAATHTSQAPLAVECSLPMGTNAASSKYRSINDPANQTYKKFLLVDTPGHGKLRNYALDSITNPQSLKGIVFLLDAAGMSTGGEGVRQASEYIHDVLLLLQKHITNPKTSRAFKGLSVLIAANKMDLFTALPATLVKTNLETEITKIRDSKSKALLDSGISMGDGVEVEEKDDWLGEMGSSQFRLSQMSEFNITVEVVGGNVLGTDGAHVDKWWAWIGERL